MHTILKIWQLKLLLIFALVMGTISYDEELLRPRPRGGPAKRTKVVKKYT